VSHGILITQQMNIAMELLTYTALKGISFTCENKKITINANEQNLTMELMSFLVSKDIKFTFGDKKIIVDIDGQTSPPKENVSTSKIVEEKAQLPEKISINQYMDNIVGSKGFVPIDKPTEKKIPLAENTVPTFKSIGDNNVLLSIKPTEEKNILSESPVLSVKPSDEKKLLPEDIVSIEQFVSVVKNLLISSGRFESVVQGQQNNIDCNSLRIAYHHRPTMSCYQTAVVTFFKKEVSLAYMNQVCKLDFYNEYDDILSFFFDQFSNFIAMIIAGFHHKINNANLCSFNLEKPNVEIFLIDGQTIKFTFRELGRHQYNLANDDDIVIVGLDDFIKQIISYKNL
jgi:hypothetical protein